MSQNTKHCPGCGQTLRIPEGVGGVAMACPNCGSRIPSFFKFGGVKSPSTHAVAAHSSAVQSPPPLPETPRMPELDGIANMSGAPAGKDMPDYPEAPQIRTPLLSASGLTRYKLMLRQG